MTPSWTTNNTKSTNNYSVIPEARVSELSGIYFELRRSVDPGRLRFAGLRDDNMCGL